MNFVFKLLVGAFVANANHPL